MRAVTYDFWNTLMWAEPGMMGELRRGQIELAAEGIGLELPPDAIEQGLLAIGELHSEAWMRGELFNPRDGADHFIASLGEGTAEKHADALTAALLLDSVQPDLNIAPEVEDTLEVLKENGIRTAIVCDVGLAPSTVLRRSLESAGLIGLFDAWAFSDEVGHYKPSPEIFRHALESIEVAPEHAVHVGDLRRTDVAGSRSFGMTAVRYTGLLEDDDHESAEADHVITSHSEILKILGLSA
ncbi:MAG: HAD family hydrolase [Solirubrobacterales bacterium]|nr:HAD family hydrolase [Solirubrobacterales bacterium]HRV60348.1 HAD family hydrolase [Solirubrobacterales bacterium]